MGFRRSTIGALAAVGVCVVLGLGPFPAGPAAGTAAPAGAVPTSTVPTSTVADGTVADGSAADGAVDSATVPDGTVLRVATKPLAPFVSKRGETLEGFSVELWDEVARRNGWRFEWQWHEKVGEVLDAVEQHRADVAIAGISMTDERERRFDFSYPMFNSGLQVAIPAKGRTNIWRSMRTLLSGTMVRLLLVFLAVVLIAGHVIWLVERGRDEKFAKGYSKGLGEGLWQAGSTLVQAGYGDRPPDKLLGRIAALMWMFIGIALVAQFTAVLTTQQTLEGINGSVRGVGDLPGKRVVTVDGSTAAKYLTAHGIAFEAVAHVEDAYPRLSRDADEPVDAVVYDAPVLANYASNDGRGRIRLAGGVFQPEPYGIALAQGSALREPINRALLAMNADGTSTRLNERWFGTR